MSRRIKDFCRICGKYSEMTFEHVPPKVTFNKNTKYKEVAFLTFFESKNPFEHNQKGKVEQGGVGYYSLCSPCNSNLGSKYVSSFNRYSNSFINSAEKKDLNYFEIEMHDFEVLKVLKQTISMFLAMNSVLFSKRNKELADFVSNLYSQNLPEKYRIFIYLNSEGQLRNLPLMTSVNFSFGLSVYASELSFPPLGHVLTIGFDGDLPYHHEITHFKNYSIDEKTSVVFKMFRLPTHLPILLDYREKSTIQNRINNSGH
ncbi:hypothetical protein [Algoriphagus antarcticus]|uniref:HNH endonuclease n=1 Tax=Algoriphagus antarcticus TaxID=238540 RepID=A0A3E0DSD6_9BACT|nr:hypothetical protein [Algoriphagus antarcticus]REG86326.1 hypothetical protein C8N25_11230 [Algoriphagus antarcticus]